MVIIAGRRPVGPIVLLLERRLRRRPVIWCRGRPVVLHRRRRVIPILDSDGWAVVETASGTGFVGEASRRQWDQKRWEHRF